MMTRILSDEKMKRPTGRPAWARARVPVDQSMSGA